MKFFVGDKVLAPHPNKPVDLMARAVINYITPAGSHAEIEYLDIPGSKDLILLTRLFSIIQPFTEIEIVDFHSQYYGKMGTVDLDYYIDHQQAFKYWINLEIYGLTHRLTFDPCEILEVRRFNVRKKEIECSCTGYDLFHFGHKCGRK